MKLLKQKKNGADYLGVGAMYSTGTKKDADSTSMNELRKIRENVSIPIVVIGGINKDRVKDFKGIGIDGLAIVSAIIAKEDITTAAKELKNEFIKI
ncbi:thiamine-phosphate diphosphorylase [Clostridium beijerinckii]|nr:thiamine-phosphate diphosphorylase [Clostridium beijerinckii]